MHDGCSRQKQWSNKFTYVSCATNIIVIRRLTRSVDSKSKVNLEILQFFARHGVEVDAVHSPRVGNQILTWEKSCAGSVEKYKLEIKINY